MKDEIIILASEDIRDLLDKTVSYMCRHFGNFKVTECDDGFIKYKMPNKPEDIEWFMRVLRKESTLQGINIEGDSIEEPKPSKRRRRIITCNILKK